MSLKDEYIGKLKHQLDQWNVDIDVLEARAAAGISDGLIRIAVGLEHIDDLKADLASLG